MIHCIYQRKSSSQWALQASNGTITLPNVAGGSSQYVVTSTGLNTSQTSEASSVGSISELSESVSLYLAASKQLNSSAACFNLYHICIIQT